MKWLKDRLFTILGIAVMLSSLILFGIQYFSGLGMPEVFGNVLIATILNIGILLYRFGQKKDEYRNISEI